MKNSLSDLNNHLFAQLERLGDEDLKPENMESEINRSKAITSIAKEVINNARLALDAQIAMSESGIKALPTMLDSSKPLPLENTGK